MENLNSLIPRSKQDLERAKAVVKIGYPSVAPILPELLEWLQDYNWPVAQILAPFLADIGSPIVPHVRHVLDSEDDIWKYWVLSCIVKESPEIAKPLQDYLQRLSFEPTPNEINEGLNEIALDILDSLSKTA